MPAIKLFAGMARSYYMMGRNSPKRKVAPQGMKKA